MTDLMTQYHQYLIYALVALQVLDGITTIYNLTRPGVREANKIMKKLFDAVGVEAGVAATKIVYSAFILMYGMQIPPIALAGLCILYTLVFLNNVNVAYKSHTNTSIKD